MQTPFFDQHVKLGAKIVDYHGWQMPVQYTSIIDEHKTVRSKAGLFDVSHMGRFRITGKDSIDAIQNLITNDITKIKDNQAIYSPICNEDGGIVDDVIWYRLTDEKFFVVANSSNIEKDFQWIKKHIPHSCKLEDFTNDMSLVALQGPNSEKILSDEFGIKDVEMLKPFHLTTGKFFDDKESIIAKTGYTGEDGFEIFIDSKNTKIWEELLNRGRNYGIKPCGLGARDTLRLEAGLMLYGNDLDENVTPLEAPLSWTVKFSNGDFIGKKSLEEKEVAKKLRGFEIVGSKRVARRGNRVIWKDKEGSVTSGTYSPTFDKPIGFCFLPKDAEVGDDLKIEIGSKYYEAKVTTTRFYKRN